MWRLQTRALSCCLTSCSRWVAAASRAVSWSRIICLQRPSSCRVRADIGGEGVGDADGVAVRHLQCGCLVTFTASHVRLGAEDGRAGGWVGVLLSHSPVRAVSGVNDVCQALGSPPSVSSILLFGNSQPGNHPGTPRAHRGASLSVTKGSVGGVTRRPPYGLRAPRPSAACVLSSLRAREQNAVRCVTR